MPKTSDAIHVHVSSQVVRLKPGGIPATFEVEVVNQSRQFASFQLEIEAAGADPTLGNSWYQLSPEVSTKKPPGNRTQFRVTIKDPPVPGFVGTMNLLVLVSSLELRQEGRQIVRLILEPGTGKIPLGVNLPTRSFQARPHDLLLIPVHVLNPGQIPVDVCLKFSGVDPSWLTTGCKQQFRAIPGSSEAKFLCRIPATEEVVSGDYLFAVEASHSHGLPSSAEGSIRVTPDGYIDFVCTPAQQTLPEKQRWLPDWQADSVTYQLQLINQSNLDQQVQVSVEPVEGQPRCDWTVYEVTEADSESESLAQQNGKSHAGGLALAAAPSLNGHIPGGPPAPAEGYTFLQPYKTAQFELEVSKRRPLLGWSRRYFFLVRALVQEQRLDVRNDTQLLRLRVQPLIPGRTQLLGILGFFVLFWIVGLNPWFGHQRAVNSVQFNGAGDRLVSAADDQSIRHWQIGASLNPAKLTGKGALGKAGKAVRVVRYRPVSNDLVAAGLENGDVQLWNAITPQQNPIKTLSPQKDDRVLDLAFSRDARYLFSSHGSGTVQQWAVDRVLSTPDSLQQKAASSTPPLGFAAYALATVGEADHTLAIGGQFNRLLLWDWQKNTRTNLTYPPGSKDDYILSLATADYQPNLLAVSDNQGNLSLITCTQTDCKTQDNWKGSDRPILSVAFSPNGCYLASAGDDGRVMLWAIGLDAQSPEYPTGKVAASLNTQLRSVALSQTGENLVIATGGNDSRVRTTQVKGFNASCGRR